MRRLSISLLAALFTTTAYAFSPVCPEFTATPTAELPESLTATLNDLTDAIKKKDVEHLYDLVTDDVYFGDGFETRLGEYGFHNRRSPMWNELSNALYAGCALLESGEDVWECPGVREELFFGAGEVEHQKKKYSYIVEIARPIGYGGPLLGEPYTDNRQRTICQRSPYSTVDGPRVALPELEYIRKAMEDAPTDWRARVPPRFNYLPGRPVIAWFKYSHYRMRFKEIDGKWRMTALFRKY